MSNRQLTAGLCSSRSFFAKLLPTKKLRLNTFDCIQDKSPKPQQVNPKKLFGSKFLRESNQLPRIVWLPDKSIGARRTRKDLRLMIGSNTDNRNMTTGRIGLQHLGSNGTRHLRHIMIEKDQSGLERIDCRHEIPAVAQRQHIISPLLKNILTHQQVFGFIVYTEHTYTCTRDKVFQTVRFRL